MATARVCLEKLIQHARPLDDGALHIDSVIHLAIEVDGQRGLRHAVQAKHTLDVHGHAGPVQVGRPLQYSGPWHDELCSAGIRQYLASLEQSPAQWFSGPGGSLMHSRLHLRRHAFEFPVDDPQPRA